MIDKELLARIRQIIPQDCHIESDPRLLDQVAIEKLIGDRDRIHRLLYDCQCSDLNDLRELFDPNIITEEKTDG